MTTTIRTLESDLAAIVGAEHLRPAEAADAVDGVPARWVVAPGSAEEVAAVLSVANEADGAVIPRGGGSKLAWGHPPRAADIVLSTQRLDQVVEHAWGDMTATVEAGCPVARFQAMLAQHGQRLACDPLWPARSTVGGILSTQDSGAQRQRFRALRDQVIGLTVALPDGTLAKSGGKVVKNVAGYDLPKLLTGAFGTLGVITQATFRLYPLPAGSADFTITADTVAPLQTALLRILDSTLVPVALQLRAGVGTAPALDVRFEGQTGVLEVHAAHLRRLAATAGCADSLDPAAADVWQAREVLWQDAAHALIARVSVLPAQLADLCAAAARVAGDHGLAWQVVAQAAGTSLLRLAGQETAALPTAVVAARKAIEALGGTLVVLGCPPPVKAQADVWGDVGDSLALMRRIKAQFDPAGIMNPGRFVGGI